MSNEHRETFEAIRVIGRRYARKAFKSIADMKFREVSIVNRDDRSEVVNLEVTNEALTQASSVAGSLSNVLDQVTQDGNIRLLTAAFLFSEVLKFQLDEPREDEERDDKLGIALMLLSFITECENEDESDEDDEEEDDEEVLEELEDPEYEPDDLTRVIGSGEDFPDPDPDDEDGLESFDDEEAGAKKLPKRIINQETGEDLEKDEP